MTTRKTARDRGKNAERWLAKQVNGKRILRKGEKVSDVDTDFAVYEVKEREELGGFLTHAMEQAQNHPGRGDRVGVVALVEKGHKHCFVCLRLEDWLEVTGG